MILEILNNYKYIHIMIVNSITHNETVVNVINEIEEQKDKHLYVITNEELYNGLKKYNNIIFDPQVITEIDRLKKYSEICEFIFFHSLNLKSSFLFKIPKNVAKKIIWITWGHDVYRKKANNLKDKIKNIMYYICKFPIKKYKVKQFFAIGVGFKYDIIEIKRIFGDKIKILPLPYGYKKGKKANVDKILNIDNSIEKKTYNIMIGHCAYNYLKHISCMEKILKYKNENIKICLVLAYGNMEYASEVEKYAIKQFGKDKVEVIKEPMSDNKYIEYLKNIDICILDFEHQAALGNLWRMLYLGKKIYLSRNGILKLATDFDGAETYCVDDIEKMPFNQFIKKIENYEACKSCAQNYIDENNYLTMWKNSLNQLNKI